MKGPVIAALILASVIVSRLFIFSFRHIPLTNQAGGQEPLYALVGGVALAFSVPMFPLLLLYLSVLIASERSSSELNRAHRPRLLPAGLFLFAFVVAFVLTISGVPYSVAKEVYKAKWIIDLIGGVLVAIYGVNVFIKSGLIKSLRLIGVSKRGREILVGAPVLGFVTGLLLFHHLDPFYDSIFFLTGRAGAFSHHPLSVGSFGSGLSAVYITLAYGFGLLVAPGQVAKVISWLKAAAGVFTIILGLSFATGASLSREEVARWTNILVSGP